jgi:hypothetical protein
MKKYTAWFYIFITLVLFQLVFAAENKLSHKNIYSGAQKYNYDTNHHRFIPDHKNQVKKQKHMLLTGKLIQTILPRNLQIIILQYVNILFDLSFEKLFVYFPQLYEEVKIIKDVLLIPVKSRTPYKALYLLFLHTSVILTDEQHILLKTLQQAWNRVVINTGPPKQRSMSLMNTPVEAVSLNFLTQCLHFRMKHQVVEEHLTFNYCPLYIKVHYGNDKGRIEFITVKDFMIHEIDLEICFQRTKVHFSVAIPSENFEHAECQFGLRFYHYIGRNPQECVFFYSFFDYNDPTHPYYTSTWKTFEPICIQDYYRHVREYAIDVSIFQYTFGNHELIPTRLTFVFAEF